MALRKRVREGVLLAEALVGLAVALLLLLGLCTMLQQWRRGAAALERRSVLLEGALRAMRAAAREDFEALAEAVDAEVAKAWLAKAVPLDGARLIVKKTGDEQVLAVRIEVVELPVRVVLERLVARPEASLGMEGAR